MGAYRSVSATLRFLSWAEGRREDVDVGSKGRTTNTN